MAYGLEGFALFASSEVSAMALDMAVVKGPPPLLKKRPKESQQQSMACRVKSLAQTSHESLLTRGLFKGGLINQDLMIRTPQDFVAAP